MMVRQECAKIRKQGVSEFMENRESLALDHALLAILDQGLPIALQKDSTVTADVMRYLPATDAKDTGKLLRAEWRPMPLMDFRMRDPFARQAPNYLLRIRLTGMLLQ